MTVLFLSWHHIDNLLVRHMTVVVNFKATRTWRGSTAYKLIISYLTPTWLGPNPLILVMFESPAVDFCNLAWCWNKRTILHLSRFVRCSIWNQKTSLMSMDVVRIHICPNLLFQKFIFEFWRLILPMNFGIS